MNFRKKTKGALPTFQMTAMMDIVFLLLCFFVTTSVFSQWENEVSITLPTAQSGKVPDRLPGEIIINIEKDGRVSVNQQEMTLDALKKRLVRLAAYFPGQPVVLRADKATSYENLMKVIDTCRQADIWNFSMATSDDKEGTEKK
ncbi:MAG: biopolymer transporter ExbD [Kiritimatiellae bacterium]|nr:biopolymer transporter ExbD [Kiritimatiellia bacterium]MBP5227034.1 biopolymer transporter ExbD [Kiritimatiellia bacterium]